MFYEPKRRTGEVTQRMLTKQLRELEADGLILHHVYPEVPPKVEYSLTETGETRRPLLMYLREWEMENVFGEDAGKHPMK